MNNLIFILLIVFSQQIYSQRQDILTIDCLDIMNANDIDNSINIKNATKVFLKCSPKGFGEKIEVASGGKKDKYFFEKEHNVIWFKFKILVTSELLLTIKPKNPEDDYDFLLFKVEDENTINQIKSKTQLPIRSNLARNNKDNKGVTGLSFNSKTTHTYSGPQYEFSKSLKIEKDEEYYLVLDNVYDNGQGAIIEFNYFELKKISGYVTNNSKTKNLDAELNWEDIESGQQLRRIVTNPKTGYFEMEVPYSLTDLDKSYVLTTSSDGYLFKENNFTVKHLHSLDTNHLSITLSKLEKGERLIINNINFKGGEPIFIPSALPSLKRLTEFMKKNDSLKILIEGHTNGCSLGEKESQILSERRALRVKKYLFENEIDISILKTIGYGCSKIIYPQPKND
ncbi:MAG: OmpA family protein [Flavobacteriales bacterium]|nr:OmpA family protein [Flavobacteriales bacterium]